MVRSCLLLVVMLGAVSLAVAQTAPTLHVDFERGMDGAGPAGSVKATVVGQPKLVPGKVGQGLQVGPGFGRLDFASKGLVRRDGGTVEMWVCPVDWESKDGKFHVFFECRGEGSLYLYEYFSTDNLLMLTCPKLTGPYASAQAPTDFKPGQWRHVAGTWAPSGVQVYLDGKPAGTTPVAGSLPTVLGELLQIGDEQWQFPRTSSSIIDDVRVYDRALSPAHIAAHAKGDHGFTKPLDEQIATLTCDLNAADYTVTARLDTGGADVADDQLQVRFSLLAGGQQPAAGVAAQAAQGGQATATIAFPARQPGNYDLIAQVAVAGQPAFQIKRTVTIPTTEWLGNRIGLEDKVLPPWTPLKTKGTDVSVWGRTYSFAAGAKGATALLPTQITTKGAPVLARPITLNLSSGGNPLRWMNEATRLISHSDTKAALAGSGRAILPGGGVNFRTAVKAEYDGLMLFEVTCDKPDQIPADGLTLEIPVKAENALYRHRYGATWIPTSGNVPPGEGVVDKTPWVPFVWLGDNDRGLFWFTEDSRAWANDKAENAIEIVRQGSEIIVRVNLLGPGEKLPADWKFVFGLQATPVKPIPRDWRKWRMTGSLAGSQVTAKQNIQIVWPNPNKRDSLAAFGWPEAADPAEFTKYMKAQHDAKLLAVPYLCLTWVTDSTPEWQWFRPQWDMGGRDGSIPEVGWKHQFALVSPVAPGYADFVMYRTKQFVDRYGIDGSYHDQTHPYMSDVLASGVGYLRDGKPHAGTPILGYRELYRRNYALFKGLKRPTFLQAHMSGKVTIPVLAYEDSYLDGEHFRGVVKDSYLDVMTLDSFRCEYMGRQWGIMPFFLPEFDEENRPKVEPTRGMMGLLLIHDVNVWPIWCNAKVVDEALKAMDDFGWVDADFLPYFDPQPPATTRLKDVYVSAYRRSDGQALLVIANLGREDQTGTVRVDLKRLGVPATKVVSWPDKQPLALRNGTLELTVPGLGYRLVRVGK